MNRPIKGHNLSNFMLRPNTDSVRGIMVLRHIKSKMMTKLNLK